jgi:hypothetical protein
MNAGDQRSGPGVREEMAALRQSNGMFAAQLVLATAASYSRSLLRQEGRERGGEWLRQGLGQNNNSDYTNKNNWGAAFVRPIFLSFFRVIPPPSVRRAAQEPQ